MQELEKILEEIDREEMNALLSEHTTGYKAGALNMANTIRDIIRKHMNDGWTPADERLPDNRRSNYEVTFINECGYEEHGFSQWYDGEFHIPAVVIAWREHLKPYRPERSEEE